MLHLLRLNDPEINLNVSEEEWRVELAKAKPDPSVGIRHAAVKGDADWRIHVAAIPEKVGCHFHQHGDEVYQVVEGQGVLHCGPVNTTATLFVVEWDDPLPVKAGDRFVVPEGFAHQLQRTGKGDLTILFGCPDDHLDDDVDRTMLPDAAGLASDHINEEV